VVEPVVAVSALLLRNQMPDLLLRPGTAIVARVASRGEEHGVLVLAGVPITAQLPDEVQAGATLYLRVREVGPERVVLSLDAPPINPAVQAPPAPRAERARVTVGEPPRRGAGDEQDGAGVTLAFESPALGRLDLRIELGSGSVRTAVTAPAGRAFALADAGAERLREGLEARTGLAASVRVTPRREPLDLYA
jgi:D-serine deaminase-like pyridoxal phosphate-dependent protein